jgi:hypothetical protein
MSPMVITRKSFLNSSTMLITAVGQLLVREFKPPPGEKGNLRIRYAEIGSGFPLLATVESDLEARRQKSFHHLLRRSLPLR